MNKKSKVLVTSLASIAMSSCLLVGGTYALFTDKSDVNITVSSGTVDVEATVENAKVYSGVWNGTDYDSVEQKDLTFLNDVDGTPSVSFSAHSLTIEKMTPMDKVTFDIRIHNGSDVKAMYQTVVGLVNGTELFTGLEVQVGEAVYNGMTAYSAWEELPAKDKDIVVPVSIELPQGTIDEETWESTSNQYMGKSCEISYAVRAVQGNAHVSNEGTTGAEENTNFVYTKQDFELFARAVNGGNSFEGKTVKLMSNIDLGVSAATYALTRTSAVDWLPIGGADMTADGEYDGKTFNGTFDGNGKTISGMTVSAAECVGLFAHIDQKAVVKNVNITGATVTGNHWVGGLVGYAMIGKVENCHISNSTISATPNETANGYDNGDKVGGLVGYAYYISNEAKVSSLKSSSATNVSVSGYRDVGGLVGSGGTVNGKTGEILLENNTIGENVNVSVDQITNFYGVKDVNAGSIVGRNNASAGLDASNKGEANISVIAVVDGVLNIPANTTVTVTGEFIPFTVSGAGTLVLDGATIAAENGSALTIAPEFTGKVVVNGDVTLTGATGGNGILVAEDAKLDLSGAGSLTAIGNAGTDGTVSKDVGGSGIGGAGEIYIHDLAALTAEGYGAAGFGIGGATAAVTIKNTTIAYAKGGYVQSYIPESDLWGKKTPEGGAAIGSMTDGAVITLENVTIEKIEGGSKSAAIGARYHTGVTVDIKKSNIKEAIGGNAAAAIGGSRVESGDHRATDAVTVKITDSMVTAFGGDYAAGIGSGYDTHCHTADIAPLTTIEIKGNSVINATAGKYGAGIGTGHNVLNLVCNIEDTVTVDAKASTAEDVCCLGATCIPAEDVGYGSWKIAAFYTEVKEGKEPNVTTYADFYTRDGQYYVFNAKGLQSMNKWFAANRMANSTWGKTYNVMADIDASDVEWNSVYMVTGSNDNNGIVLNGNGYTITGLTINGDGMFSGTANGSKDEATPGVVKDITFDDTTVNAGWFGGVVWGNLTNDLIFENVNVLNSSVTATNNVGAIIASTGELAATGASVVFKNCKVENCTLTANGADGQDPTGASAFMGRALGDTSITFEGENVEKNNTITNKNGLVGGGIYAYTTYVGGTQVWANTGKCDTFTNWMGLPSASVSTLSDLENINLGTTLPSGAKLDYALNFTATQAETVVSDKEYKNWIVDFEITFDKDIFAGNVILMGQYGSFGDTWYGFPPISKADENTGMLKAGSYKVIEMFTDVVSVDFSFDYDTIVSVVESFNCGVVFYDVELDKDTINEFGLTGYQAGDVIEVPDDLNITLQLKMYTTDDNGNEISYDIGQKYVYNYGAQDSVNATAADLLTWANNQF